MITIYYNNNTTDRLSITERAIIRLLQEGNTETDIQQAIGAEGIQYEDIANVDTTSFNCDVAEQMVADGGCSYVIEIDENDEPFFYVGVR